MRTSSLRRALATLAIPCWLLTPAEGLTKTLLVASNGIDGPSCGGKNAPCRSITQAIVTAAAGDKIVVGPGRYGDVNGNGVLGESGEEPANPGLTFLIRIEKPVSIESRDGAAATIIDAGGLQKDLVRIDANGVVFGKPKKGFTLQNAPSSFFGVLVTASEGSDISVAGNRAVQNGIGFQISAPDVLLHANRAVGNEVGINVTLAARARVVGNEVIDSVGAGLRIGLSIDGLQIVGNGFSRNGGPGVESEFEGGNVVLRGNVAGGNLDAGFALHGDNLTLTGNVASANGGPGFLVNGKSITVTKNAAVANLGPGVEITSQSEGVSVTGNTFIGNGRSDGTGCGIFKFTAAPVNATGNFWGAPTGPGPAPADEACDDTSGNNLTTTPFAPKEIKVKPKLPKIG